MSSEETRSQAVTRIDRRSAIKRGVGGAAAAGLVWSAPRVEGLSLRPRYAAAQSGGFGLDLTLPADSTSIASCGGGQFVFNGGLFSSEGTSYRGNFSYLGAATGTINGMTWSTPSMAPTSASISFGSNFWQIFSPSTDADTITVHVEFNCV